MGDAKNSTSTGRLGRDTLIYGLAFLAARAASFIMLPVYTRTLVPADYATLHLLQMSLEVAEILLSAGVTAGVQRYYFKVHSQSDRGAVLWASLLMLGAFNLAGGAILWFFAPEIADLVLHDVSRAGMVRITAVSFSLEAYSTIPMLLLQIRQRAAWYGIAATARLVLQVTLNVIFLIPLDMGVRGLLISTLITYAVGAVALMVWFVRTTPWSINRALTLDLWRFGLPYRFTTAGTFTLTYVDRYFLSEARGLDEVGIYSLAYQFGFLLMYLGPAPFHLAWDPQRFQLSKEPESVRNHSYAQGFLFLTLLLGTLAVGISIFVSPVIRIMAAPSYFGAADLVPVLLLAFVFQALGHVEEFGIQVSERTQFATFGTWIAVAVILVGYLVLIPPYGAMGAASATVLAYAVRWLAFRAFSQRLFPVDYAPARGLGVLLVGVLVVISWLLLRPDGISAQLAVGCLIAVVWFAYLWRIVLHADERQRLIDHAKPLFLALRAPRGGGAS